MRKPNKIFLLCTFLALLFASCAQEDYLLRNESSRLRPNRQTKSFSEALDLPMFNASIQKLSKTKGKITSSPTGRTPLEEKYDFTIVESAPVKILVFPDGTVKYVLLIERETKEELKFENLILTVKDEQLTAYLIKYELSEKPEKVEGHNSYSIELVDKKVEDLEVDGKKHFMGQGCWDIVTIYCCDRGECQCWPAIHLAQAACFAQQNCMFDVIATMCPAGSGDWIPIATGPTTGGGTAGGTAPGNSNNNGDGSNQVDPGAVPNHNEEVDIVVVEEEEVESPVDPDPCKELKDKFQDPIFKVKVASLNTPEIIALNHETGYAESRSYDMSVIYPTLTAGPKTNTLNIKHSLKPIAFNHVHNDDYDDVHTVKMFSMQDIQALTMTCYYWAQSFGLSSSQVYGTLFSSSGNYAIKLLKSNLDVGAIASVNWINFQSEYEKQADILQGTDQLTPINSQKLLLNLLRTHGLENIVGLYQPNNSEFTDWNRLKLNTNGTEIVTVPCN